VLGSRAKKTQKGMRYYKNIGLGFKTPTEAIEGSYVDKKCPFTGNVSIRGRILKGLVVSTKMKRTIVVRRDYLKYISKYRYDSMCVALLLALYLHLCLYVSMSVCLYVSMPVCLYACMSVCLYVSMPVCLYICISVCLYICMSVCLYIYISIYLTQLLTSL
jgi:hypothetical protein